MRDNREIDIYIYTYTHKSKGNQIFRYFAATVVDKIDFIRSMRYRPRDGASENRYLSKQDEQ